FCAAPTMFGMCRYERPVAGGPMCTDSSANLTTADSASAVEETATDLIPSSRHARATPSAISPRVAIRTLSNILEVHQRLLELHPVAVRADDLRNASTAVGLHLVHELHRLDDRDRLALVDDVALLDEHLRSRLRRAIERPDERRDDRVTRLGV